MLIVRQSSTKLNEGGRGLIVKEQPLPHSERETRRREDSGKFVALPAPNRVQRKIPA